MENPATASTPIDSVIVRFAANAGDFVEHELAQMKSIDLSIDNYIYVTTPHQGNKVYDISLSINGQDFWPYNTTSGTECFSTQIGLEKTLKGVCISCSDDDECSLLCSGSVSPKGSTCHLL